MAFYRLSALNATAEQGRETREMSSKSNDDFHNI